MNEISWDDFQKVELRVGTVIDARDFPEARNPAYILRVDFGSDIGIRKSSARVTAHYRKDELIGKKVIGVVNFPPKQIGPMKSECLITGFYVQDGNVVLAVPDKDIHNGAKLG